MTNTVKSSGASGKYRTYTRGDTGPGSPRGPSGKYRSYTKEDKSSTAPSQAAEPPVKDPSVAQRDQAAKEAQQEFITRNPQLPPGVYSESLSIQQGVKTKDYIASDIKKDPMLVDQYNPRTRRPYAKLEQRREVLKGQEPLPQNGRDPNSTADRGSIGDNSLLLRGNAESQRNENQRASFSVDKETQREFRKQSLTQQGGFKSFAANQIGVTGNAFQDYLQLRSKIVKNKNLLSLENTFLDIGKSNLATVNRFSEEQGLPVTGFVTKVVAAYPAVVISGSIKNIREYPEVIPVSLAGGAAITFATESSIAGTTALATATKGTPLVVRSLTSGIATGTRAVPLAIGSGIVVQEGVAIVQEPTEERRAEKIGELLPSGIGLYEGSRAATGVGNRYTNKAIDIVRSKYAQYQFNKKYAGQLSTDVMSKDVAAISRDLSVELEVKPIKADLSLKEVTQSQGVKTTETARARIYDKPVRITGEQLAKKQDTYLSTTAERKITELSTQRKKNLLTSDIEQSGGFNNIPTRVIEDQPVQRRVTTAGEILRTKPTEGISTVRFEKSNLPIGEESTVRQLSITKYQPIELSSERSIVRAYGKKESTSSVQQLDFEPPRIGTTRKEATQVETLRPFNEEAGDYYIVDKSGKFILSRSTEFRKFPRGTKGIPGRETITTGKLPDSAGTQKNLPPELIKDFLLQTDKGGYGPVEVIKVEVKPKKSALQKTTDEGVEISTSGGVLILEPLLQETKTETVQQEIIIGTENTKETEQVRETLFDDKQGTKQKQLSEVLKEQSIFQEYASTARQSPRFATVYRSQQQSKQSQSLVSLQENTPASLQDLRQREREEKSSVLVPFIGTKPQQDTIQNTINTELIEEITTLDSSKDLLREQTQITKQKSPSFNFGFDRKTSSKYDVEARRFGKFYRFTTQGLPLVEAVRTGELLTDTTLGASFKIVESSTGRPVSGTKKGIVDSLLTKKKFLYSKKNKDVIVEKRGERLSNIGETTEISGFKKKGIFNTSNKSTGIFGA